jgi:hypothetical protein
MIIWTYGAVETASADHQVVCGGPRSPQISKILDSQILSPPGGLRGAFNKCIFWLEFPEKVPK